MHDENIRALVQRLMDREVTPILPPVPGIDLEDYKATLIERFANPAIRDQLSRIRYLWLVGNAEVSVAHPSPSNFGRGGAGLRCCVSLSLVGCAI